QTETIDAAMTQRRAKSSASRQTRVETTTGLAQKAIAGAAERIGKAEPKLGTAFSDTAKAIDTSEAKTQMHNAAAFLAGANWAGAAGEQKKAAATLQQLYVNLKVAAAEAARRVVEEA